MSRRPLPAGKCALLRLAAAVAARTAFTLTLTWGELVFIAAAAAVSTTIGTVTGIGEPAQMAVTAGLVIAARIAWDVGHVLRRRP